MGSPDKLRVFMGRDPSVSGDPATNKPAESCTTNGKLSGLRCKRQNANVTRRTYHFNVRCLVSHCTDARRYLVDRICAVVHVVRVLDHCTEVVRHIIND